MRRAPRTILATTTFTAIFADGTATVCFRPMIRSRCLAAVDLRADGSHVVRVCRGEVRDRERAAVDAAGAAALEDLLATLGPEACSWMVEQRGRAAGQSREQADAEVEAHVAAGRPCALESYAPQGVER